MKKKQNLIVNATIPIILLIGLILMVFLHTQKTWEATMQSMTEGLHREALSQASALKDKIDGKMALLDGFSAVLTKEDLHNTDKMLPLLQEFVDHTDFITVSLADTDGTAYRNDGEVTNLSDCRYFGQCLDGKRIIERVSSGDLVKEARFEVAVPVIVNEKVQAVLVGEFDDGYMSRVFEEASEGGSNFTYVCNSGGELITATGNAERILDGQVSDIREEGSVFDILAEAAFEEGSGEQVEADMQSGNEGHVSYNYAGEMRYAIYLPVDINDWYVVTVLKESAIRASVMEVVRGSYVMLVIAVIVAALLIVIIVGREKKEQMRAREEADHLKEILEHDSLTGLITDKVFGQKARNMIREAESATYCMVFFDIYKFKSVNDMFGRKRGDELLCAIAAYINRYAKDHGGISCRISGDGFAMLLPNDLFMVEQFAQAANSGMWGLSIDVYMHFGVYVIRDTTVPVDSMIDYAKIAQKTIKGNYDNYIAKYDESIRKKLRHEQEIVSAMARALEHGEFVVYLQPQYNYENKKICGAEALVRWQNPQKGLIPPGEFIPVFETNGFITKLDEYVWEQVCKLLAEWKAQGKQLIPVSVNVSRADLYKGSIVAKMKRLVEKYQIEPSLLQIEITETAYMDHRNQLIADIMELRKNGFIVEMDDFGSGYSSLNMLKDLPIHVLKTDLKFLDNGGIGNRKNQILDSVVDMAHRIGLSVVAEGVETKEQAEYLLGLKCETMQGYYFSRPISVEEFEQKFLLA